MATRFLFRKYDLILLDGASRDTRMPVHELRVAHFLQEDANRGGVQMGEGRLDPRFGLRVSQEVLQRHPNRRALYLLLREVGRFGTTATTALKPYRLRSYV